MRRFKTKNLSVAYCIAAFHGQSLELFLQLFLFHEYLRLDAMAFLTLSGLADALSCALSILLLLSFENVVVDGAEYGLSLLTIAPSFFPMRNH